MVPLPYRSVRTRPRAAPTFSTVMSKRSKTIGTDPAEKAHGPGVSAGSGPELRREGPSGPPGSTSLSASSLPVRRSFVVQFHLGSSLDPLSFEGRIEHIVSGRSSKFAGGHELLEQLEAALIRQARDGRTGTACP